MANLTRWDPFSDLTFLQNRVNQLFNQPFALWHSPEQSLGSASFFPPVDIYEDDRSIILQAEIPGIQEKDLDIQLENNVLTVSGERKLENEEKKENFHRIERHYGRFSRSFGLPATVDPDSVNAEFDNGVLKVTVAKREEAKSRQIKIGPGKTSAQAQKPGKAA